MVIAELIQENDKFHFNQDRVSIQQYSSGVKIHVQYDESYDGYIYVWRYSQYIGMADANLLEYDSEKCIITLPYAMFKEVTKEAKVYIQGKATKDDHIAQTNTIILKVVKSLNDTQIVSPDEPSDITLITDIVDQKFKIDIIPHIDGITADAKQYRDEAKTSADQAEITLNEVVKTADCEKATITETASNETKKACVAIEAYKNDKKAELQTSVDGWKGEISAQGNEIIQDANVILTDVSTISETVSENAETVKTSTQQAETYRDDAGRHASNADLSAQQASASAENALASKADAETAENNAKASETIASQKASDASASEKKAKEYWTNAQAEAFNASRSATSALDSKNGAQINADAIRSSADKIASTEITANKALGDASIAQLTADAGIVGNKKNGELIKMLDINIDRLKQKNLEHAKVADADGHVVTIADGDGSFLVDYRPFGETNQDATVGAQLLDFKNGINVKNVTENSFDIVATNDNDRVCVFDHKNLIIGERYFISFSKTSGIGVGVYVLYTSGEYTYYGPDQIIEIKKEILRFAIYMNSADIGKTATITNPMLNKGTTIKPFRPYTGGVASPSPDCTQELISKVVREIKVAGVDGHEQKVTFSQPITLRGLPVTTGGNVTIDGQQYISDSIEMVDGIYGVKGKVKEYTFNGNELWTIYDGVFYYTAKFFGAINGLYGMSNMFRNVRGGNGITPNINEFTVVTGSGSIAVKCNPDPSIIPQGDLMAWKNYLSRYNLKIIARHIDSFEIIPLEDQIKIKSLCTFKGSSNITDDTNTYKQIRYVVDFDKYAYLKQKSFELALIKQKYGYAVYVDDSANYYPKSIGMFGETHQTTTTGANYIDSIKYDNSVDNGIAFTKNVDGSVLAKGTSTSSNAIKYLGEYINDLEDGAKYISSTIVKIIESGAPKYIFSFTVNKNTMTSIIPYIQVQKLTAANETMYPILNKGDKLLPWEACTGGVASPNQNHKQEMVSKIVSEIKANNCGYLMKGTYNTNVQKIALKKDATYYVDYGGATANNSMNMYILTEDRYFSNSADLYNYCYNFGIRTVNNSGIINERCKLPIQLNSKYKFTVKSDGMYLYQAVNVTPLDNNYFRLFYETNNYDYNNPYQEQKVTFSQPITLRGLPVTDGGNVTIDGQLYRSDSIELVDGEYGVVRRIGVVDNAKWLLTNVSAGTSGQRFYFLDQNINLQRYATIMCTHYTQRNISSFSSEGDYISSDEAHDKRLLIRTLNKQFDTIQSFIDWTKEVNMETFYQLENEIIEPLPLADQQAIKELQTYSHNTNITADGAWLSVEYVADQQINNDRLIKRLEALEGVVVNNV